MTLARLVAENALFFALTLPCLAWGWWRYRDGPRFPGPRVPWPAWFRIWFKVIWLVGGVLPLAALLIVGFGGDWALAGLVLGPYFVMFAVQIATELWAIRIGSPIWIAVPCLYLPWRLVQLERALVTNDGTSLLLEATVWALIVLWVINIWVHYTGIPNQMRWSAAALRGAGEEPR